jgi:hypothetical protein
MYERSAKQAGESQLLFVIPSDTRNHFGKNVLATRA